MVKKGIVSLVSSRGQRAAVIPLINWLSTARQPVFNRSLCPSIRFKHVFVCSCFQIDVQYGRSGCSGGRGGRISPRRTTRRRPALRIPSRPALPAPPCRRTPPTDRSRDLSSYEAERHPDKSRHLQDRFALAELPDARNE